MRDPIFCPSCGGEMEEWHNEIFECEDCQTMIDLNALDEEVTE